MLLKHFDLNNYLFCVDKQDVPPREQEQIERRLRREMAEIFYGRNLRKGLKI
jgi:S-adenosylmethionine decarboxylase